MGLRRIVAVSRESEIQNLARRVGQEIFVADDMPEALDIIETVEPDLVICDTHLSPRDVSELLDMSDNSSARVPVVVVGGAGGDSDGAEDYLRAGAYAYLEDASDAGRLEEIVRSLTQSPEQNETGSDDLSSFFADQTAASVAMVGKSNAMRLTLKMIRLVAASNCNPVLIVGETGTGKEKAAEAVHMLRHPDEPFVAVNCAALTANLLESELFGHAKGAFTGADHEKTGLLELAGAGTLFLDEISEMPLDLQAKLLRVVQERTFRKVGGITNIACNATIIASSNRNLKTEVKENRFRRDLYYRLDICPIRLASLSSPERRQDIALLARYFLKTSSICPEKKDFIKSLTKMAVEALERHDWAGNVRELRNVIERAIMLETTDKIGLSSIIIDGEYGPESVESLRTNNLTELSLAKAERDLIGRALEQTGWQKTHAAALLGITRATLYAKVKQYNIRKGKYLAETVEDLAQASAVGAAVNV
jgi:DNA-binding NtrC family response regulator